MQATISFGVLCGYVLRGNGFDLAAQVARFEIGAYTTSLR